jgi:radical SAM protein with 4Fe4S-binding SPASM domain
MHYLSSIEWSLSNSCNLDCLHCYQRSKARHSLPESTHLEMAKKLVDGGVTSVTLTGGEPLLVPHWHLVARFLKENGVSVQLISNGQLITSHVVDLISEIGFSFVWMSLDGSRKVHDFIRGKKGAFDKVMEASDRLSEKGVPFGYLTTLLNPNLPELSGLAQIAKEKEATAMQVWMGIPVDKRELFLKAKDFGAVKKAVFEASLIFDGFFIGDNIGYGPEWDALRHPKLCDNGLVKTFRGCTGGVDVAGITSDGVVKTCLARKFENSEISLIEHSLETVATLLAATKIESDSCPSCGIKAVCYQGCPAISEASATLGIPMVCMEKVPGTAGKFAAALTLSLVAMGASCASTGKDGSKVENIDNGGKAQPTLPSSPQKTNEDKTSIQSQSPMKVKSNKPPPLPKSMNSTPKTVITIPAVMNSSNKNRIKMPLNSCCFSHMLVPGCKCSGGSISRTTKPPVTP